MVAKPSDESHHDGGKCRYKTGKCLNDRSYKRNGQFHQLCNFHREKANRIQRKFDRQKRIVAKSAKSTDKKTLGDLSPMTHRSSDDFLSDTDSCGRPSTDSSCSESFFSIEHTICAEPVPVHSPEAHRGRLSFDELDFLCSAIL
ncbi:hypothetical protein SPRG_04095 [Saprolegnia parasitica CBS 223.65]|uniref:Uncharacterized protein n=1 Tax=Saprolegnia parasitica (strain CBS 223.65) TaxID=695850 RepID=A0A067CQE4_SAPPC|nr:hypothetical protein SPRG_04095 [Saprolegnia parasitica CBS 223.65]KDO31480.1 hypothetical protein SPRG_04095 [Saprolegnia parasitica CBS 223.65]|eukprot:XP_012198073.1 hypothetical protein SPRG_04095 [Saprolegnia parasitica CBS 223.65]